MSITCWCILGTRDTVSVRGCRVFKHRSHFLKGRNGFIPGRTQEAMRSIPPTFGEIGMEREEGE